MNKYIIFGTGSIAKIQYEKVVSAYGEDSVECFIDSMLQKTEFCGKAVIRPEHLKDKDMNSYKYILGSLTNKTSMINELKGQGVSKDNIVIDRDYGSSCFEANVKSVNRILIYPEIENVEDLTELDNKFTWLVPNLKMLKIKPEVIHKDSNIETINFNLIKELNIDTNYDMVLVWDKSRLEDKEIKEIEHIYCIDPYYFNMIDVRILLRLNYILEAEHIEYSKSSRDNFIKFLEEHKNSASYIFGAGPSCKEGLNTVFEPNAVKIVCNDMVVSGELFDRISPNVYVMSDEKYTTQQINNITEEVLEYVINNNCILVVPEITGAVLIKRYPKLKEKIVRLSFDSDSINFPTPENMTLYRKAYNVITALAIPIASSISSKIYIAGCDGNDMENHVFGVNVWNHADELNENKISKFTIKNHEENWKEEYYYKHIAYFEEVLDYGEKLGKKYISYTNSFIPALKKRNEVYADIETSTFGYFNRCIENKEVFLYGASQGCINFLKICGKDYKFKNIIDSNMSKWGTKIEGYEVVSPEILEKVDIDKTVVIITSVAVKEISKILKEKNIRYIFSALKIRAFYPFAPFNVNDFDKLKKIRNILADEKSKYTLDKIIEIRNNCLRDKWEDIYSENQYFCDDIFTLSDREVFVDGGAYTGDTALKFAKKVEGKYKHIYSFEPDKNHCKATLDLGLSNNTVINKGLWNEPGKAYFDEHGSAAGGYITECKGVNEIVLGSIDDDIKGEVTFIKMDIEGAEMKALEGAKNTIINYKPKLAICVYHKPEDLVDIIGYLMELVPEYEFYLRHHSVSNIETVVYAKTRN